MYKVALIQNQSEMSHYSYADARPILQEFGYETYLYTAENIDGLSHEIESLEFDAVIFGSNALNDKTIRSEVQSTRFTGAFSQFLNKGKGCLILHQLRMAQFGLSGIAESNIQFLPKKLNNVQPIARESDETASDGQLIPTLIKDRHPIWLYPNYINISEIKRQCLSFPSLKGLYWHYWDTVDTSEWDIHIYDEDAMGTQRSLLISSKQAEKFRIILSSLTLDWQKQKNLLQNMLIYTIEGKHDTALLIDSSKTSVAFNYLIELLCSQKYPFRLYDIDTNLSIVNRNIQNGIHTIVVLGPFVDKDKLGSELYSLIERNALEGKVKLIGIDQRDTPLKRFFIAGRERFALRLLYDVEMKIQKELRDSSEGYIDGSFWSTAESLQTLNQITMRKSKFDDKTLEKTFQGINIHDRDGSYDEVFGVTCALLWLRGTYLGLDSEGTNRTLIWIKEHLNEFEDRERALAYSTLVDIEVAQTEDIDQLRQILLAQSQRVDHLSETDLIVYLRAAIQINMEDVIRPILVRLEELQSDGCWIDLATTATATIAILDALKLLKEDSAPYSSLKSSLEVMIFKSIIYIQDMWETNKYSEEAVYPWDNKASTSLKCIHAWLKFEELVDLPVYEMIESLGNYSKIETQVSSGKIALDVLEDIKSESRDITMKNVELYKKIEDLSKQVVKYKNAKLQNKVLGSYLLISFYVCLSIVGYIIFNGLNITMEAVLKGAFVDSWRFHIVFLTLIFTIIGAIKFKDIKHIFSRE